MSNNFAIPESYAVVETTYRCQACGIVTVCRTSADNSLVKFVNSTYQQEAWLPTFGVGGYLEIVEKCVPGYSQATPITMDVFRRFDDAFRRFQHRAPDGGHWQVALGCRCTGCGSRDLEFTSEQICVSPPLNWLTYLPIT